MSDENTCTIDELMELAKDVEKNRESGFQYVVAGIGSKDIERVEWCDEHQTYLIYFKAGVKT